MKLRLPHLPPMAKAQLWGMATGLSLGLLTVARAGLSYRIFFVGFATAWIASEFAMARRLTGKTDGRSLAVGVITGLLIPWGGVALAFILQALRP